MMQVRSVTFFVDSLGSLDRVAAAGQHAREALASAGYRLQTIRLATTPFPDWFEGGDQVASLAQQARAAGIDYLALGPVRLADDPRYLDQVPWLVAEQEALFASAEIADCDGQIDTGRAALVAAVVRQLAKLRPDGFANLYFTATANCAPGSPFFPVSYHDGGPVRFALATEAADLAVQAFRSAGTLKQARANLVGAIEREASQLVAIAGELAERHGLVFGGIDFSLAPYPEVERSLGAAVEALGVAAVGGHGSLFAAAFLADCVDRARLPRCGFAGLMFPVLEDAVLAQRAADGVLALNDLLLYSAVCGAGLDTVPLPGDVGEDELTAILLDMAALAVRLDKPLTARLMPLPGLLAGDPAVFDFPYFAASKVMGVKGRGLSGIVRRPERIALGSLCSRRTSTRQSDPTST